MLRQAIARIRIFEKYLDYCHVTREAIVLAGQVRRLRDPDDMAAAYAVQSVDSCVAWVAAEMSILYLVRQIYIKQELDNLAYFARIEKCV